MSFALLGCGRMAARHAALLARRGVPLAFASRDPERARALAARWRGESYPSYESAIAAPRVDAVLVLTPPASHLELALAALAAGKHVVIEKPPVPSAADIDILAEAAAQAGRRALVAENFEYKPLLAALRRLLAEGAIGAPLFVQVNAISRQHKRPQWRSDPALALGGALYEGGIHWIHLMAELGPTVRNVQGFAPARTGGSALETSMLVGFDYAEGAVGTLAYSWDAASRLRGLARSWIIGREGKISFESNGSWLLCRGRRTRLLLCGLRDRSGFGAMWDDFLRALRSGSAPRMTLDLARRDLLLVEQAYATASSPPASLIQSIQPGSWASESRRQ